MNIKKILYLVAIATILVIFQNYFKLSLFAVIVPLLVGWYGSMIWDYLFGEKVKNISDEKE